MSETNCPDAGSSPRKPCGCAGGITGCILCDPPQTGGPFPHHAGETVREPGKCYCGNPLLWEKFKAPVQHQVGSFVDFDTIDSQRAQIFRLTEELRQWRIAAAKVSGSQLPPDFSPEQFVSAQIEHLNRIDETAELADMLRRVLNRQTGIWSDDTSIGSLRYRWAKYMSSSL